MGQQGMRPAAHGGWLARLVRTMRRHHTIAFGTSVTVTGLTAGLLSVGGVQVELLAAVLGAIGLYFALQALAASQGHLRALTWWLRTVRRARARLAAAAAAHDAAPAETDRIARGEAALGAPGVSAAPGLSDQPLTPRLEEPALGESSSVPVRAVGNDGQAPAAGGSAARTRPCAEPPEVSLALPSDEVYRGGFASLVERDADPIAVVPSSPRDVAEVSLGLEELVFPGSAESRLTLQPALHHGIPLRAVEVRRVLPRGAGETAHGVAVRDLIYLPQLAAALGVGSPGAAPFVWPEHCVDPGMLAEHDLVVVGGPDTNAWHALLFEYFAREAEPTPSESAVALDLRTGDGKEARYGAEALSVRLHGANVAFGGEGVVRLHEARYPTVGMLLACENPLARAVGNRRWCVFAAGNHSLGTSGAVLALAEVLERMRRSDDPRELDPASPLRLPRPPRDADGRPVAGPLVSATLLAVDEVLRAGSPGTGPHGVRGRRRIPVESRDPGYHSSFVPTRVRRFDAAHAGHPRRRWGEVIAAVDPPGRPVAYGR